MALAQPGDPLFPVTAVASGPVPALGIILLQFDFLTSPQQALSEVIPGPNYALTAQQVRDLIAKLRSNLSVLESASR